MDNESNKYVVLEGFNHEYFKNASLIVVKPKPGMLLTIDATRFGEKENFYNIHKITLIDDQFIVGYIYDLSETKMDIRIPSKNDELAFTLNASDRDKFTIDRLEDIVLLTKSEYNVLTMKKQ